MKTSKKLLALAMALVMLFSCFVFSVSAYTYNPTNKTGYMKWYITLDEINGQPAKTTATADGVSAYIKKGDILTFSMHLNTGTPQQLTGINTTIFFNSEQLKAVGTPAKGPAGEGESFRTWKNAAAGYAKANCAVTFNYNMGRFQNRPGREDPKKFTEEEKTYFNTGAKMVLSTTDTTYRWTPENDEVYVSFNMEALNIAPGSQIWIGVHEKAILNNDAMIMNDGRAVAIKDYDFSKSMMKVTVESPLKQVGRYLNFNLDNATDKTTTTENYALKLRAKIADADWNALSGTANAVGNVKRVGLVATDAANEFVDTDAITAIQSQTATKGSYEKTVTNADKQPVLYKVGVTDYVQHASAGADYIFNCTVLTSAATDADLKYTAFIEYTDTDGNLQYVFFTTPQEIALATNYGTYLADWQAGKAQSK